MPYSHAEGDVLGCGKRLWIYCPLKAVSAAHKMRPWRACATRRRPRHAQAARAAAARPAHGRDHRAGTGGDAGNQLVGSRRSHRAQQHTIGGLLRSLRARNGWTSAIQHRSAQVLLSLNHAGALASSLHLPGDVPEKFRVAWALLRASFDDAHAITVLLRDHGSELAGSVFSLLQPMNDKFKHGTWFACCATGEEVQDFIRHDRIPKAQFS